MSSGSPVLLILGSGANIGQSVARAFHAKGYKIALTSRKPKQEHSADGYVSISSDLSDPESVVRVFSQVKEKLGIPSVVVYNAGAAAKNDPNDPLSLPLADFARDLSVNTTSAFVAGQQAVTGFAQLPDSASKTFIFTGNILNTTIIAPLLSLGVGKSATAHMIQSAASAYAERGFKFYYADERKTDGSPAYFDVDGDAHATHYVQLAETREQGPWQQTFTKGVGYKNFLTT
ncbi:putative short-chain dehydrogenase [Seiridium cardinale]